NELMFATDQTRRSEVGFSPFQHSRGGRKTPHKGVKRWRHIAGHPPDPSAEDETASASAPDPWTTDDRSRGFTRRCGAFRHRLILRLRAGARLAVAGRPAGAIRPAPGGGPRARSRAR